MANSHDSFGEFVKELREKRGDDVATVFLVVFAVSFANAFFRAVNDLIERGDFDGVLHG